MRFESRAVYGGLRACWQTGRGRYHIRLIGNNAIQLWQPNMSAQGDTGVLASIGLEDEGLAAFVITWLMKALRSTTEIGKPDRVRKAAERFLNELCTDHSRKTEVWRRYGLMTYQHGDQKPEGWVYAITRKDVLRYMQAEEAHEVQN